MYPNKLTIVTLARLIVGVATVGTGYHSYFSSTWNTSMRNRDYRHQCNEWQKLAYLTCPSLFLEMFFIIISTTVLILSAALFITNKWTKENPKVIVWEAAYNVGAAILTLVAGCLVMVSAIQVYFLFEALQPFPKDPKTKFKRNSEQYFDEKLIAGILSVLNSAFYGAAGILGFKEFNELNVKSRSNPPSATPPPSDSS